MKLLTFVENGKYQLGVKTDRGIVHIAKALQALQDEGRTVPQTVHEVIDGGAAAVSALQTFVDHAQAAGGSEAYVLDESKLTLGPCVTHPNKIICVGLNYRKHAEETNSAIPKYPILFNKFNNTLTGHGQDVPLPVSVSSKVDYEAELVIVIGKQAKYVAKEHALDHVFGYCNVNDLSARDLQLRTQQWLLGKTCDGFSPLGPYLVTADEVGDPNNLGIRSIVNGEVRQNSNTSDMIFRCDEIVSYISQHMTLVPGDIILTGTPEGVVMGYPEDKQVYLKDGDVVTIEVDKLGSLTNRMVNEQT
ncbi:MULTISPECIES: fumarylacetoacetate hydrolase family protein [unclassified Paenibacillus]|uniref:fumarylacetoacetate hydrolase family protein n=1 Tax=unclassified Paenibacillus TaxID=185978 RepID=UPI001AE386D6|nr:MULTISPECIES: fumarylacetoacetate hydrolase family protein [unclassified Paenibacillus]MBP1154546.1 2-keto-4-pentenoate hydratase/2-oxohepta-3-ene-1,7-dioic acid hydratase in catechol pathway [Paenibacillus sp. PvP091]MBP1170070.1 2-keto-4-pentenoate hydratase/2-oxohepta-3-ene-1,7-dioic acid hydratase in catechol pathway [Paenibacillus sp. PvR098]MBP2441098.1 2-keto-4-pentenoate hydratase/2-oxohepta-3-ene-1,7-dioic acid hydratase in catechol pathway [Paenibacillus sp. PvP052]